MPVWHGVGTQRTFTDLNLQNLQQLFRELPPPGSSSSEPPPWFPCPSSVRHAWTHIAESVAFFPKEAPQPIKPVVQKDAVAASCVPARPRELLAWVTQAGDESQ